VNIVADENVDAEIVERLRADGHEVVFIAEEKPGVDDQAVPDLSRARGATLPSRRASVVRPDGFVDWRHGA